MSFDGLVNRKKVFSDYRHLIEANLDVVVEVLDIQSSVSVKFCLDEELI